MAVIKKHLLKLTIFSIASGILSCQLQEEPNQILTIGDSNGTFEHGWVEQLQSLMPKDSLYNVSIPGNTIGFDNLGNKNLNTLRNLDNYLKTTLDRSGHLDYVLILLGTNDSKAVYKGRKEEVPENVRKLIARIKEYDYKGKGVPEIVLISPPPYGPDRILADKYKGGNARVITLVNAYKQIAQDLKCKFINVHAELSDDFMEYSSDGVHLEAEGQRKIAKLIRKRLE